MKQHRSLSLGGNFLCSATPLPFLVFFALPLFMLSDGGRVLNKHEVSAMPRPVVQQGQPCKNGYDSLTTQAAARYGISAEFLCRVINADGPPGHPRLAAARELGVKNLSDPKEIIPVVAKLLATYLRMFGDETLAAAAYNAGPTAVQKFHGVPPINETRRFVARVMRGASQSPTTTETEEPSNLKPECRDAYLQLKAAEREYERAHEYERQLAQNSAAAGPRGQEMWKRARSEVSRTSEQKAAAERKLEACKKGNRENATCGLGRTWIEEESGYTSVWTRQGDSDIFNAEYKTPGGGKATTRNSVTLDGNKITIHRLDSSDTHLCTYNGTITGNTVNGTYKCPGAWSGEKSWSATISCK